MKLQVPFKDCATTYQYYTFPVTINMETPFELQSMVSFLATAILVCHGSLWDKAVRSKSANLTHLHGSSKLIDTSEKLNRKSAILNSESKWF